VAWLFRNGSEIVAGLLSFASTRNSNASITTIAATSIN